MEVYLFNTFSINNLKLILIPNLYNNFTFNFIYYKLDDCFEINPLCKYHKPIEKLLCNMILIKI